MVKGAGSWSSNNDLVQYNGPVCSSLSLYAQVHSIARPYPLAKQSSFKSYIIVRYEIVIKQKFIYLLTVIELESKINGYLIIFIRVELSSKEMNGTGGVISVLVVTAY